MRARFVAAVMACCLVTIAALSILTIRLVVLHSIWLRHHAQTVPACSYCAVAFDDGPATFVRSCSGGCDERV